MFDEFVSEDSVLGPLLFSVFIKDLSIGSLSNSSLFANGTSLFLVVLVRNTPENDLNKNLLKDISKEMCFNPDPLRQLKKSIYRIYLFLKLKKPNNLYLVFNNY